MNPDVLLADARGFMKARVILTAVDLDLFSIIDRKPSGAESIASMLGLDARALTRVLDVLVGLGLLGKDQAVYRVTEAGSRYSSTHPESVLPMARHLCRLWDSWGELTEVVRRGADPEEKPGHRMSDDARRAFIGAMHVVGAPLSREIAASIDLRGYRRLLDIGGGSGTYTMAFLRENPNLTAVLFDLDPVIHMARERLETEGLLARVELVAGDFYRDELPGGCDVALLSAIIHQNSPGENVALYRKAHRALASGGILLIRDHVMDESRARPLSGALFAINMLVNTRAGDTYTLSEISRDLALAGFGPVRLVLTGEGMDCVVEARKL